MRFEDERHPCVGPSGHPAVCHVRVYRPARLIVAVLCELPSNPRPSITNAAEILSAEIWALEGRPTLDRFGVVAHHPQLASPTAPRRRTPAGAFDLVLVHPGDGRLVLDAGIVRRQVFGAVTRWQPLALDELEALIGEPWTPIPLD